MPGKLKNLPILLVIASYAIALGFSFLPAVESLEIGFYQQLVGLSPRPEFRSTLLAAEFPRELQLILILLVITSSITCRLLPRCPVNGPGFVIPVLASLFMLEILLVEMHQLWLPALWPMICFGLLSLGQLVWEKFPQFQKWALPGTLCQIETIQGFIDQQDFRTALLIMKHCRFTDEMFELAYELGIKLEQHDDLVMARSVYAWLVEFDPGMQDFVERIDTINQPEFETDDNLTADHESGEVFAHYRLLGASANGATSTVREAYDLNTHKRIALKILNDSLDDLSHPDEVMTFLHEALTVSRLDHPNIVKIHDADIANQRVFIAMDFITGYPMSTRLRRRKLLSPFEALRVLSQMLDALVAAHAKGIVHGDIKPANIMYDQTRKHYVLTDFGAAYSDLREQKEGRKIIGTPAYMSPEQLLGKRLDGRSDLFSLAVTVYHLLTGVQPFGGDELGRIRQSVLTREIDIQTLDVPPCLRMIVAKALEKKPYRRFADAEQMLKAVQRCQQKIRAGG